MNAPPGVVSAIVDPTGTSMPSVLASLLGPVSGGRLREWSVDARRAVCFVPDGAPLMNHRTAFDNVRELCVLGGIGEPGDTEVTYALRLAELPDQRLHSNASHLNRLERLMVWLAVQHLRRCPVLVLEDPTRGLTQSAVHCVARLLREVTALPCGVVVTTSDATFGASLTDHVTIVGEG